MYNLPRMHYFELKQRRYLHGSIPLGVPRLFGDSLPTRLIFFSTRYSVNHSFNDQLLDLAYSYEYCTY